MLVILLVMGIFFRFANIDRKIYWGDEIFSSLRIAGFSVQEVQEEVYNGREITVQELQFYQFPTPEKSLSDVINSLASHPEHSPLYYLMARGLVQLFGYSVTLTRGLAAFISLLAFPCVYWLCVELFECSFTGGVAIALLAVSPFHVLYAQEARQYSLFIVTLLLSSAALLRAMRIQAQEGISNRAIGAWGIYSVTAALGIYSHLLFALVFVSHALYIMVCQKFRWTQTWTAYIFSSLGSGILFLPWLFVVITNYEKVGKAISWMSQPVSLLAMIAKWAGNSTRILLDLNLGKDTETPYLIMALFPSIFILSLYVYSLFFIIKNTSVKTWSFICLLIAVTALFLVIPDLVKGGQRSVVPRYLVTCYVAIHLAVAYLLANRMTAVHSSSHRRKLWQIVTSAVICSGIISCILIYQAEIWWMKGDENFAAVARVINQSSQPLVVSDTQVSYAIALSYYLNSSVRLQLGDYRNIPAIEKEYSDIFLYHPSRKLSEKIKLEGHYQIESISEFPEISANLWKLTESTEAIAPHNRSKRIK